MYILHVSVWFHLPGPLRLLPDVLSIIYPASIGQYWSRLRAPLPYWQQDNGASNNSGSEREEAAHSACVCTVRHTPERRIHQSVELVIWQRSTLPVRRPSCGSTPSCLFSCRLIVDNEIKFNCTEKAASELPGRHVTVSQMLSISSSPPKTHSVACT